MSVHTGQPVAVAGPPPRAGGAAMIMLHGRHAAPAGMLDLADALARPQVTYVAPAAAGGTWYPYSFMTEPARNEPHLSSALEVVGALVEELMAKGVRREHIVLLGFSQGACLASEFAVRHAARYGGLVALSGGLIGPPGTVWKAEGSFAGMPAFFGCSDVDPHIPLTRVDESVEVFDRMDAAVTRRIYPGMGHTVNADEIRFTQRLLDSLTPAR